MNIDTSDSTGDPLMWKTICVPEGGIIIGRASARHAERAAKKSNMYFENSHISKSHAKLSIDNKIIYLEDRTSTFGTMWNNHILVPYKKVAISEGDRIGFALHRPSNWIKELTEKACDSDMVSLDILLYPLVQLLFFVVSIDAEEGSLVLLPLEGKNCLAHLRAESQAKKRKNSLDTEKCSQISESTPSNTPQCLPIGFTPVLATESDDPPIEESYERKFCRLGQASPDSKRKSLFDEEEFLAPSVIPPLRIDSPGPSILLAPQESASQDQENFPDSEPEAEKLGNSNNSRSDNIFKDPIQLVIDMNSNDSEISDAVEDTESLHEDESADEMSDMETPQTETGLPVFPTETTNIPFMQVLSTPSWSKTTPDAENVLGCEIEQDSSKETQAEKSIDVVPLAIPTINQDVMQEDSSEFRDGNFEKNNKCRSKCLSGCDGSGEHREQCQLEDFMKGSKTQISSPRVEEYGNVAFGAFSEDEEGEDDDEDWSSDDEEEVVEGWSSDDGSKVAAEVILVAEDSSSDESDLNSSGLGEPLHIHSATWFGPPVNYSISDTRSQSHISRKRSHVWLEHEEMSLEADLEAELEISTPKRAKTRSLGREIGKGFLYVVGTLAALVAYGGYLEKTGAQ